MTVSCISDYRLFMFLVPHITVFRIPYSFGESHDFWNLHNSQLIVRAKGNKPLASQPSIWRPINRLDVAQYLTYL